MYQLSGSTKSLLGQEELQIRSFLDGFKHNSVYDMLTRTGEEILFQTMKCRLHFNSDFCCYFSKLWFWGKNGQTSSHCVRLHWQFQLFQVWSWKKEVTQVSASTATELSRLIVESHKSCYHPFPFFCLQRDLTCLEAGCLMISFEVINFAGQAL